MKNYTSIEQSKKLLELGIDPLTSDMCYKTEDVDYAETEDDYVLDLICRPYSEYLKFVGPMGLSYKAIPCWSLAALLNIIPKHIDEFNVLRIDISTNDFAIWYDEIGSGVNNDLPDITKESAVDACVVMIEKLHELNLL